MKLSVQTSPILEIYGIDEGFRMIRDAGFEAVDYNIDINLSWNDIHTGNFDGFYAQSDEKILEDCHPYKDAAEKYGITFTQAHAPFPNLVKDDRTNKFVLEAVKKTIMCCGYLGCKNLIVHPGSMRDNPDFSLAQEWDYNIAMYSALIPDLKKYGVTCCLENMFWGRRGKIMQGPCATAAETNSYIETLNEIAGEKVFGYCLDVGHALLVGRDIYNFILDLGDNLTALHIHDNNGLDDQHLAPYMGLTDWDAFCRGLKEIGYQGDLSFETFNVIHTFDKALTPQVLALLGATAKLFRDRVQS